MVGPDGFDRLPEPVIPQEVIDFLDEMTPGDVCKERIGDWNIQVEGFSGECMADIERRMNLDDDDPDLVETPEDVYDEVLDEFRNEAKGYAIAFLGIWGDPEAEQPILACVDWAPDPEITQDMEMSP